MKTPENELKNVFCHEIECIELKNLQNNIAFSKTYF